MLNAPLKYLKIFESKFADFPPIFMNTLVRKNDIKNLVKRMLKNKK